MGKKGPHAKLQKNRAYYKRFTVKLRRRRQAKTDYAARTNLIRQAKNKYNMKKYRFVVRRTNKDIVCQFVAANATNDDVLSAAYSHELPRYGIKLGLTNYAACYATGLLAARRMLKKIGLDQYYEGETEVNGEECDNRCDDVEWEDENDMKNPFTAYLDVGLRRTTTGARVFGALKGATDGGVRIPHRVNRFPGFPKPTGEDGDEPEFNAETHKSYIFGGHVANYMRMLEDSDPEAYKKQFGRFIKEGIAADDLEDIYAKAHAAIRANPAPANKDTAAVRKAANAAAAKKKFDKKFKKMQKRTLAERQEAVRAKIEALQSQQNAAAAPVDAASGSGDDDSSDAS